MSTYAVYILTNRSGTLYTGVTNSLADRLREHRTGFFRGAFSARYRLDRLIHVEWFATGAEAAARERQIKGWTRAKKIWLIELTNPEWRDLAPSLTPLEAREEGEPERWARGPRRGIAKWKSTSPSDESNEPTP